MTTRSTPFHLTVSSAIAAYIDGGTGEIGGSGRIMIFLAEHHGRHGTDIVLIEGLFLDELVHDIREVLLIGDAVDYGNDRLDMAHGGVEALPLG